jgi:hypothetical protein
MPATLQNEPVEIWWKTYLRGTALILPGLVIWGWVRTKCVPILSEICHHSGQDPTQATMFWDISMLAVRFGFGLLPLMILGFVLLELLSPDWRRSRRVGVSGFVWLVNLSITAGLAALFTSSMICIPQLLK